MEGELVVVAVVKRVKRKMGEAGRKEGVGVGEGRGGVRGEAGKVGEGAEWAEPSGDAEAG